MERFEYHFAHFTNTGIDYFGQATSPFVGLPRSVGEMKTELAYVSCKARVAPMKLMTVPKLELQAAHLAARFKTTYIEH